MTSKDSVTSKGQWRTRLLAARRDRDPASREAAGFTIAEHGINTWSGVSCVAAYHSLDTEPPTHQLIDGLIAAGVRVLLPVLTGDELDWSEYDGTTEPGQLGIAQPVGPRLGAAGLALAEVVIVAALAVDRRGIRLGRGRGHYDRTLARTSAPAVAVVFADEVVDELPAEPHDRPVTAALTPDGLLALGQ